MEVVVAVILLGGLLVIVNKSNRPSPGKGQKRPGHSSYRRRGLPPVTRPNSRRVVKKPLYELPKMPQSMVLKGRVYVIDGDTIRINGTKIRLAGIDAPELDMPWGQKSKWAMVSICKGQFVTAELDGERSYDRLVGTCYLPDGRDIGAELVKLGLALDLPEFSRGKYRHLEPPGARRRLANGRFGHTSIRVKQSVSVRVRKS